MGVGATQLVIVGGDGSVNEVVNGVVGGTSSLPSSLAARVGLVRTFRHPRDLDGAIDVALRGAVRAIDAGRVSFRTWAGATPRRTSQRRQRTASPGDRQAGERIIEGVGGKVSYYWATLAVFLRWQTGEMRVTVGDETRSGRMIDAMICNGRFLGGGMMMCPDAEPDDGVFDVLLIGDVTKRDLAFVLPKTYKGKHLPHPRLELLSGSVVTVDAERRSNRARGEQQDTTPRDSRRAERTGRAFPLRSEARRRAYRAGRGRRLDP